MPRLKARCSAWQAVIDDFAPAGDVAMAVSIGSPRDAFLPFVGDRIKLVCPSHHQLPWFEERFVDHEACMAASADMIIVGHTDFARTEPMVALRARVKQLLAEDFYRLAVIDRTDAPRLVVWVRNG